MRSDRLSQASGARLLISEQAKDQNLKVGNLCWRVAIEFCGKYLGDAWSEIFKEITGSTFTRKLIISQHKVGGKDRHYAAA